MQENAGMLTLQAAELMRENREEIPNLSTATDFLYERGQNSRDSYRRNWALTAAITNTDGRSAIIR